ncbi:hypothetical protein EYF80_066697 [Liparis tanakae]|uniref:Uncharacterized protein n=1 Tax=Liparis tanakae TaxID=230148 RepID=A0A4Z2E331_9TELE|nr:hypothetical protein EYF80_066697 [Liparis tanakae]
MNDSAPSLCVQSADDFSERSLRMAEVSRDQRNLEEEEEEEEEENRSPVEANKVNNGDAPHVAFMPSTVAEEEEEEVRMEPAPLLEQKESSSSSRSLDSTIRSSSGWELCAQRQRRCSVTLQGHGVFEELGKAHRLLFP